MALINQNQKLIEVMFKYSLIGVSVKFSLTTAPFGLIL